MFGEEWNERIETYVSVFIFGAIFLYVIVRFHGYRQLKRTENLRKLNSLVPQAVTALEEVVGPSFEREDGSVVENDQKVRVKAAKEILNRAGYKSHEKNEGQPISINMYIPPHMRKPGEEDKETITITIDPKKDGRGDE